MVKKAIIKFGKSYWDDFITLWVIAFIPCFILMLILMHHPYGAITLSVIIAFIITLILKGLGVEIIK